MYCSLRENLKFNNLFEEKRIPREEKLVCSGNRENLEAPHKLALEILTIHFSVFLNLDII